jgi:hypothetical protein
MNIQNATDKSKKKSREQLNTEKFAASLVAQIKGAKPKTREQRQAAILRSN